MREAEWRQARQAIESAWQRIEGLPEGEKAPAALGKDASEAVESVIAALDQGRLRVAEPPNTGSADWIVHGWIRQAIHLYFRLRKMECHEVGPFSFRDKIPLKRNLEEAGVRVVPPGVARYGSFLEPGVILMPGYVNIGAYVGTGTLVDTWATVGSCAQVGCDTHLSGGVGLGGVLEPIQARPVIVEDGAFIGSRCVLVEGVRVGREAVLGAGCVLTASTPVVDVTGREARTVRGLIPPRAVLIPGSWPKRFPSGIFHVPCALKIGERSARTDAKTALNMALRDVQLSGEPEPDQN